MTLGFFMKVVVADRAGMYVDAVYINIDNHAGLSFIMATIFFSFQIFGDFAGYSFIAIGSTRLFVHPFGWKQGFTFSVVNQYIYHFRD